MNQKTIQQVKSKYLINSEDKKSWVFIDLEKKKVTINALGIQQDYAIQQLPSKDQIISVKVDFASEFDNILVYLKLKNHPIRILQLQVSAKKFTLHDKEINYYNYFPSSGLLFFKTLNKQTFNQKAWLYDLKRKKGYFFTDSSSSCRFDSKGFFIWSKLNRVVFFNFNTGDQEHLNYSCKVFERHGKTFIFRAWKVKN